ncbi:MAG: hypothetical protein NW217_15215 [Hyphomicrobiaceae bacterium]|nr:hypothetical protein [Hyphomicrobiaceae bacterium]
MAGRSMVRVRLVAMALLATGSAAQGQDRSPYADDGRLRIVSWDLADAIAAGVLEQPQAQAAEEPAWRHTFGAERRIAAAAKTFDVERLKADIVLLQGVPNVREARRLFPARDWKLIMARHMLSPDSELVGDIAAQPHGLPASAVALRYQRSLRAVAVEHPLEAPDEPTVPPAEGHPSPRSGAAALAVRISYAGSFLWVVSGQLPPACHGECPPARALTTFLERQQGLPVVLGGKVSGHPFGRPLARCNDQSLATGSAVPAAALVDTGSDTLAGCMVFIDIE